jgi:hypothetical protein
MENARLPGNPYGLPDPEAKWFRLHSKVTSTDVVIVFERKDLSACRRENPGVAIFSPLEVERLWEAAWRFELGTGGLRASPDPSIASAGGEALTPMDTPSWGPEATSLLRLVCLAKLELGARVT